MRTMILKEDVGRKRLDEALRKTGLMLVKENDERLEQMSRQIWMTSDRQSAVHAVDDSLRKIRYLSLRGKEVDALAEQLAEALPLWTRDDLLKHALDLLAEGSDESRQQVAYEVAAEMDEYDAASAGVLTAFLKMDEPSIRLAGVRALRTRPWSTFRGTAEKLSTDPDPEVATAGKEMLARILDLNGP
ncbi:hypothetical protein [Corallococcus sp. EGB]|uniref:hypothetical protein n=1 Tax=Corallococcus sp. EGB TaxID=1521117 RepID=UPI001CC001D7|nr:hypothetical protein [Corallococcus sp. EGB]